MPIYHGNGIGVVPNNTYTAGGIYLDSEQAIVVPSPAEGFRRVVTNWHMWRESGTSEAFQLSVRRGSTDYRINKVGLAAGSISYADPYFTVLLPGDSLRVAATFTFTAASDAHRPRAYCSYVDSAYAEDGDL